MTLKGVFVEQVRAARASGRDVLLQPPAADAAIDELEARSGKAISPDMGELLQFAGGFALGGIRVVFHGLEDFAFDGLTEHGVTVAADGRGNFWVVDVTADGERGVVLFVVHDPPVVMLQAGSLSAFIKQVLSGAVTPQASQGAVTEIWRRNPRVVARQDALASSDPVMRAFAEEVGDGFVIADLRERRERTGFVWGTAGPNTEVRRDPRGDLLFAIEARRGNWMSRLVRRRRS